MEALAILGVLVVLGLVVVAVPALLVGQAQLRRRVAALEAALEGGAAPAAAPGTVAPGGTDGRVRPETGTDAEAGAGAEADAEAGVSAEPRPSGAPVAAAAQVPRGTKGPGPSERFGRWLRGNWAVAVAGVSLALAGVFLVQYGVEQGLLTPAMRVLAALGLGAALVVAGDVLRRRHGDAAAVPSGLAGAGLIVLFAAVLAARALYGLVAPGPALGALVAVAALAVVLGWFHGPVLSALGLAGAGAAPFLVGGESAAAWLFFYYFALLALVGLAVDAARGWRWLSWLALGVSVTGAGLLYMGGVAAEHFLGFWALVVLAAVLVPGRSVVPRHPGPSLGQRLVAGGGAWPDLPVMLAAVAVALASGAALLVAAEAETGVLAWLALALTGGMAAALIAGTGRAPGLADLPALPVAAALALVALDGVQGGPLVAGFRAARLPEAPAPLAATALMAGGAVLSLLMASRMRGAAAAPAILWALGAALTGPGVALTLELAWQPGAVLGGYPWALHVMAMAALMVALAARVAPRVAEPRLVAAIFAGAALTLIALALFVVLSKAALTVALAVMVLATAAIDRRYDLPLLTLVAQAGVAAIGYRLVIDPGIGWAVEEAGRGDVALAHLGPLALLAAAWWQLGARGRRVTRGVVESTLWSVAAILLSVVLMRALGGLGAMGHAGLGLMATVWLSVALAQLWRLRGAGAGAALRALRSALAVVTGAVALGLLGLQAVLTNPLVPFMWRREPVLGPPVFDSLAAAYLPVALCLAVAVWRMDHLPRGLRRAFACGAAGYAAWYGALEIRRLWQGRDLSVPGVLEGELYSYTVALMAVALALLALAVLRRSEGLRRIAMVGVALTVAKVFVIDMGGLAGLWRVAAFLGLGLSLAGLAWINARITARMGRGG
jgi:uncharacterized membrane protein